MSEPMYLQGDTIALANTGYATQEVECCECNGLQELEVEQSYRHGETVWYVEFDCTYCGVNQEIDGWY